MKDKLKILELAISLYPCPPFKGENIIIKAQISKTTGLICVAYSKYTSYCHVSEWRDILSNIIGFDFFIYDDNR